MPLRRGRLRGSRGAGTGPGPFLGVLPWAAVSRCAVRAVGCWGRAAVPCLPPGTGSAPGEQGSQLRFGNQPRAAGEEQPCPAEPLPRTMHLLSSSYTGSCLPSADFTRGLLHSLRVILAVTTYTIQNTQGTGPVPQISGSELSSCCLFHVATQNVYGPSRHINRGE